MTVRHSMRALLLAAVVLLSACAPNIPNKVTPDEYAVYSDWATQRFAAKPPDHIFVDSQTFIFDPLETNGCGNALHARNSVPWSLIKQLHDLGEARYPLDMYGGQNLRIPWAYQELNGVPNEKAGTYRIIGFSRVAFNRNHTEALFAASNSCGGECGGAAVLAAHRQNGKWTFRPTDCGWLY